MPHPLLALTAEFRSLLDFSLCPALAKYRHIRDFQAPDSVIRLRLAGTVHSRHFRSNAYPIADLGRLIRGMSPDLLLLEIRPDYGARGWWADCPADMAYGAALADEHGIPVAGFDAWLADHNAREDAMARNLMRIVAERLPYGSALALTGYSHVFELSARLMADGWTETDVDHAELRALFQRPAPLLPSTLTGRLRQAADRARSAVTPFDGRWADSRDALADRLDRAAGTRRDRRR